MTAVYTVCSVPSMESNATHKMQRLAKGYRIVDSGDPLAKFELLTPNGITVTITETRREAVEISHEDKAERESGAWS